MSYNLPYLHLIDFHNPPPTTLFCDFFYYKPPYPVSKNAKQNKSKRHKNSVSTFDNLAKKFKVCFKDEWISIVMLN